MSLRAHVLRNERCLMHSGTVKSTALQWRAGIMLVLQERMKPLMLRNSVRT